MEVDVGEDLPECISELFEPFTFSCRGGEFSSLEVEVDDGEDLPERLSDLFEPFSFSDDKLEFECVPVEPSSSFLGLCRLGAVFHSIYLVCDLPGLALSEEKTPSRSLFHGRNSVDLHPSPTSMSSWRHVASVAHLHCKAFACLTVAPWST